MLIDLDHIRRMAEEIRAFTGEDDDTFLDTLDGETDAMDLIGYLVRSRVEAEAMETAAKEAAKTFTERARRLGAKADKMRDLIGGVMGAMGVDKLAHPLATISKTKPRLSLSITDETEIPSQLCKRVPDNAAIKAALEAGENVPGAELKAGEPGLTVRVK